jgi:hypothetical protein
MAVAADLDRENPGAGADTAADPATNVGGEWAGGTASRVPRTPSNSRTSSDKEGVFVVHAVLLHTGKVLWFSGGAERKYRKEVTIFDPLNPSAKHPTVRFPGGRDIFCCHHVQVYDGRILLMGGTDHLTHKQGTGDDAVAIFDPKTRKFDTKVDALEQARWYPTSVVMGDGRVFVVSGLLDPAHGTKTAPIADQVEVLSKRGTRYRATRVTGPTATPNAADWVVSTYPSLHLCKAGLGGKIVYTGTTWGYQSTGGDQKTGFPIKTFPTRSFQFSASGGTIGTWTEYTASGKPVHPNIPLREEGMAVLLPLEPPDYEAKILVFGGGYAIDGNGDGVFYAASPPAAALVIDRYHSQHAKAEPKSAEILDTSVTPPTWTKLTDMSRARINGNAVLLPDGRVLVWGGHDGYKWSSRPTTPTFTNGAGTSVTPATNVGTRTTTTPAGTTPSLAVELFDPTNNTFTVGAKLWQSRTYHGAGLLLPDGRVLVAGGVEPNRKDNAPGSQPLNRKSYQFYSPPYFFNGARPKITSVKQSGNKREMVDYGSKIDIEVDVALADIEKILLMRPGAMTHHTDSEQRLVYLEFTAQTSSLQATIPSDPTVLPPGWYMLWVADKQRRPCESASWIRVALPVVKSGSP